MRMLLPATVHPCRTGPEREPASPSVSMCRDRRAPGRGSPWILRHAERSASSPWHFDGRRLPPTTRPRGLSSGAVRRCASPGEMVPETLPHQVSLSDRNAGTMGGVGFDPVNLGFRFLLELVSLVGLFRLGLAISSSGRRWAAAAALVIAATTLWATFRVPGDRSANGEVPIPTKGLMRLAIEPVIFTAGASGWFLSGPGYLAWANLGAQCDPLRPFV